MKSFVKGAVGECWYTTIQHTTPTAANISYFLGQPIILWSKLLQVRISRRSLNFSQRITKNIFTVVSVYLISTERLLLCTIGLMDKTEENRGKKCKKIFFLMQKATNGE